MTEPLELDIVGDTPKGLDLEPLQKTFSLLAEAASELSLPGGIINVSFVDDKAIQELNREFSDHDYATDVLSFNYLESGGPIDGVIGEIAISHETAARQAQEHGMAFSEEVALLAIHGVLHIGGYDHQTEADQSLISHLQERFMTEAGYQVREFKWEN